MPQLECLTVRGFKSIRALEDFELRNLNVLIGTNGAGKSNFIDLFPDRLDNATGLPVGWQAKPLDGIAEFINGLALQKYPAISHQESLPVIKIAELRNGISSKSNRASFEIPEKYIIKNGDFLFSWSGSLMAKFWTEGEGALNQHLFKVTSEHYPPWFYANWVYRHL